MKLHHHNRKPPKPRSIPKQPTDLCPTSFEELLKLPAAQLGRKGHKKGIKNILLEGLSLAHSDLLTLDSVLDTSGTLFVNHIAPSKQEATPASKSNYKKKQKPKLQQAISLDEDGFAVFAEPDQSQLDAEDQLVWGLYRAPDEKPSDAAVLSSAEALRLMPSESACHLKIHTSYITAEQIKHALRILKPNGMITFLPAEF